MACHENACVSSPPATGPVAVPITPAVTQAATPRRSPYTATRSSRHPTSASAPPSACTHRAAISTSIDCANAHHAEEPANTAMPTALRIRGCARAKLMAVGTAPSPSTRLNAISTQATCPTDVSRCRRMSGSASVTTAESASTSATVTASRGATARRTRPSSQPVGFAMLGWNVEPRPAVMRLRIERGGGWPPRGGGSQRPRRSMPRSRRSSRWPGRRSGTRPRTWSGPPARARLLRPDWP